MILLIHANARLDDKIEVTKLQTAELSLQLF